VCHARRRRSDHAGGVPARDRRQRDLRRDPEHLLRPDPPALNLRDRFPAIAHVFLSFGFGDDHVAVSVEARKERGEGYSSIQSFFKRYELIYVVGDERDLIRVRTNYRHDPSEDVYLYRVRGPLENARRLFLEYVRAINALRERPVSTTRSAPTAPPPSCCTRASTRATLRSAGRSS
jgi:hypothetical protein